MTSSNYDIAIIGSGLGSLACASFIAQLYNKKIIVVEQYSQAGGLSQSFRNKDNVSFEIGIHQVGELNNSSMFSKLMKLISGGNSHWRKLPDTFIKFHFPDFIYEVIAGEKKQTQKLITLFPDEKENIIQYYKDIEMITQWYRNFTLKSIEVDKETLQNLFNSPVGELAMLTTQDYLDNRFNNEKIKSLLGSHWTDYGIPPRSSAFLKHAILVNNHKDGVYYPEYGSEHLISSIEKAIRNHGGELIFNTLVKKINHINGKATSLTVLNKITNEETEIKANFFISGIGAINTYKYLFDKSLVKNKLTSINNFKKYGVSFVKLYATLKSNPKKIGADASLSWVYSSYDHDLNFKNKNKLLKGIISQYSISFPSLKKTTNAKHSMKINSLINYSAFQEWEKMQMTDDTYAILKNTIGKTLLNDAERLYPGLNDLIESWDIITPKSSKKITQHFNGNIFGLPDTPERFKNLNFNCFTPLKNVFLTGSDITTSGVYAAVLSGMITTSAIFKDNRFFMKVFKELAMIERNTEKIMV